MAKQKRKLTPEEKAAKKRRKLEFMTIFVNGKQKRVRRPVLIEGMHPDDFLRLNADPLWLHQEGEWHLLCEDQDAASIDFPEEPIAETTDKELFRNDLLGSAQPMAAGKVAADSWLPLETALLILLCQINFQPHMPGSGLAIQHFLLQSQ